MGKNYSYADINADIQYKVIKDQFFLLLVANICRYVLLWLKSSLYKYISIERESLTYSNENRFANFSNNFASFSNSNCCIFITSLKHKFTDSSFDLSQVRIVAF